MALSSARVRIRAQERARHRAHRSEPGARARPKNVYGALPAGRGALARRAASTVPSPTSTRLSRSIPRTTPPSPIAATPTCGWATTHARQRTSTRRSRSTPRQRSRTARAGACIASRARSTARSPTSTGDRSQPAVRLRADGAWRRLPDQRRLRPGDRRLRPRPRHSAQQHGRPAEEAAQPSPSSRPAAASALRPPSQPSWRLPLHRARNSSRRRGPQHPHRSGDRRRQAVLDGRDPVPQGRSRRQPWPRSTASPPSMPTTPRLYLNTRARCSFARASSSRPPPTSTAPSS